MCVSKLQNVAKLCIQYTSLACGWLFQFGQAQEFHRRLAAQ